MHIYAQQVQMACARTDQVWCYNFDVSPMFTDPFLQMLGCLPLSPWHVPSEFTTDSNE